MTTLVNSVNNLSNTNLSQGVLGSYLVRGAPLQTTLPTNFVTSNINTSAFSPPSPQPAYLASNAGIMLNQSISAPQIARQSLSGSVGVATNLPPLYSHIQGLQQPK
jgi:hypothetical protein